MLTDYGKRVNIVVVRPDFGHKQNKPRAQRFEEAKAWIKRIDIDCPVLMDTEEHAFRQFMGRKERHWQQTYILNTEGLVVYKHSQDTAGDRYSAMKTVLDRMLDPVLDKAWRENFPQKTKGLPIEKKTDSGLIQRDDFESYKSTIDFLLQPRWGELDLSLLPGRGKLLPKQGIDGSQAVAVGLRLRNARNSENLHHLFVKPLTDGTVTFYVRRGPHGWSRKRPQTVLQVRLFGKGAREKGLLQVKGDWEKEAFLLGDKPTEAILSPKGWHKVCLRVVQGKETQVQIDEKDVGALPAGPFTSIGLRCGHHGFLLDDMEILYHQQKNAK